METEKILSADSHVIEPADVWTARIDPRFLDRAPRVIKNFGGRDGDFFSAEGLRPFAVAGFAVAGVDPKDFAEKMAGGYPGVRPSAWDPDLRLQDSGARRRFCRGPLSEPRDAALPTRGWCTAGREFSRLQRLAGGLLRA
jgi:hypothetical protein